MESTVARVFGATRRWPGSFLAGAMLAAWFASSAAAQDANWVTATAGNNFWSQGANWDTAIAPTGTDAVAAFIYNPGAGDTGATSLLDYNWTIGHIVAEDLAIFGSSSIALSTTGTQVSVLSLDVSAGIPILAYGQLINNQSGGKKAIINPNVWLAGTDGLMKTGPGLLGIRSTTNLIAGPFVVAGGLLDYRTAMAPSLLQVTGGGTFSFDFSGRGQTNWLNPLPATTPLVLGGATGGGVLQNYAFNVNNSNQYYFTQQFANVTLNPGASKLSVLGPTDSTAGAPSPGGSAVINAGLITRTPQSAVVLLTRNLGTKQIVVANANDASGILGGWAVYSDADYQWASVGAGGVVQDYTAYSVNLWAPGLNTDAAMNQGINNAVTHTIRFQGDPYRLDVRGTNTLETGGVLLSTGALITGPGALKPGGDGGDLIFHVNGTVNRGPLVSAQLLDGDGGPAALILSSVSQNRGNLTLDGEQKYTGGTFVGDGRLTIGAGFGGSTNASVIGPIVTDGELAINRAGTFTLTNALTGGGRLLQVSPGTLVLDRKVYMNVLDATAGRTVLDFGALTAPQNEIFDQVLAPGSGTYAVQTARLTLRDGALELRGGADEVAHAQSFELVDLYGPAKIDLVSVPGGGRVTLSLNNLQRSINGTESGGTLKFSALDGINSIVNMPYDGVAGALLTQSEGVAYATVGPTEWAAKDLANLTVVPGSTIAGFYKPASGGLAGNVDMDADAATPGSLAISSLRFNGAGTNLAIAAGTSLTAGGVLVTPGVGAANAYITGTGGINAVGPATGAATSRDLVFFQNNTRGSLIVQAPINNFLVASNYTTTVVKDGPGEMIMDAGVSNGFTGRLIVNDGLLRMRGTNLHSSFLVRTGQAVMEGEAYMYTTAFSSIGQREGNDSVLTVRDNARLYTINEAASAGVDFNVADVNARAVLNVQDNATLRLRNFYVGKYGYADGTVNQSGGTVQVLNVGTTGNNDVRIGGADIYSGQSVGTYNLSGGSLTVNRNFQVGAYGVGTFNQSGASVYRATAGWTGLGRFGGSQGTWNISGGALDVDETGAGAALIVGEQGDGTLNVSGTADVQVKNLSVGHNVVGTGGAGMGVVNQSGGTVVASATGVGGLDAGLENGVVLGRGANSIGTYNLDGGTLAVNAIRQGSGTGTFNFNGGLLKPMANNVNFMTGLSAANVRVGGANIDTDGKNVTIAQLLAHDAGLGVTPDGGLIKQGAGVLTLTGNNTYTGPTVVSNGTLAVQGTHTGGGQVSVFGTLAGTGTVGAISVGGGGILSPGNSPGVFTATGNVNFQSNATFQVDIWSAGGVAGTDFDQLAMSPGATLTLSPFATIQVDLNGFDPAIGSSFLVISGFSGTPTGSFDSSVGIQNGSTFTGEGKSFETVYGTGSVELTVVPEPATLGLLGLALGALALRRRRS